MSFFSNLQASASVAELERLSQDEDEIIDDERKEMLSSHSTINREARSRIRRKRQPWLPWVLHGALATTYIALLTLIYYFVIHHKNSEASHYSPAQQVIASQHIRMDEGYGGNPYYLEKDTTNAEKTLYTGPPSPEMDRAWKELYQGPSFIRLSEEEAGGLDRPTVMLNDNSGYLSSLDVFHQLHCLDGLRKALHPEYYRVTRTPEKQADHIAHCLNYLRQSVMCASDITPLTFDKAVYQPKGDRYRANFAAPRMCRDFGKLHEWAMARHVQQPEEKELLKFPAEEN